MQKLRKPIRMCISCRQRFAKNELFRFKCIDKQILPFDGKGRSSYVCSICKSDEKSLSKALFRLCKNKNMEYISKLKESLVDVR